eukprot:158311-Alexandrium_andersonii.AAC.1
MALNAAVLSPGETPTAEWLMAAAMRAWGGRAAQAADEVWQIGSVVAVRWRGRMTRLVLIAIVLRSAQRHGHHRLPPP